MKYILYNKTTGQVIQSGICHPDDFLLQAQEGQGVIENTEDIILESSWEVNNNILQLKQSAKQEQG